MVIVNSTHKSYNKDESWLEGREKRSTKMKSQKGQALIMIAFGAVVLFGFAALAIDGSRIFSDKRHAQNAADTAALAAALAKIRTTGNETVRNTAAETAALARALSNGYNDDPATNDVEVHIPPINGPFAGNSEYIQVIIRSKVKTTFARVLGRTEVTNTVEAITRAQGTTTNPAATGAALAAFKEDGTPFTGTGTGTLDVIGSGIFSNSTDTDCPNGAMKLFGSITYTVETGYASPGAVCSGGAATLTGTTQTASQIPYPPSYNIPVPSFTCTGTGSLIGTEYQPGNYNGLNPPPGNYTFAPGNYCFNGNVTFNGGSITANNVNFRMNSGAFSTNGNNVFTCSGVIFHSTGGSGISFNGGSVNNCTGITFYMESGGVQWNGNVGNTFTAPTSGVYKGLLVYLPYGNSSSININGNSGSQFTGSIIAVSSEITLNGNGNTTGLHTQILGYEIKFSGNGTNKIHYNPNEQYTPPANPTIELAK
jgi:Flp pilus assembly protein TadG